jgi:glycosyltransferase involved in cell wall biosynthesis
MLGRNPGFVTTQGQKLSDLFHAAGYPVLSVSSRPNRYVRLADIAITLTRKLRKQDIVVLDVFGGPSLVVEDIASRIARRFNKPIVMVVRGGELPVFVARFPRWAGGVIGRAGIVVAPSGFLENYFKSRGFSTCVIPNTIDLPLYPYRQRVRLSPNLLWMRTFHPIYNPFMAVRVLARVLESYPDATLTMAGQEKGLEGETREYARSAGVLRSIRFPGFLNAAEKRREGARCDIFLNTNHIDNMPVSVLEACAMGMPVVATAVGGVPDLLRDGHTGLLTPDDDDEAMADAVCELLGNPDLARRLSTNGRALAEEAGWARVRPQWEELFDRILRGGGQS